MLYPLKFEPIFKERIWGGNKLNTYCNNPNVSDQAIGECWALSALSGNESVVSNGFLAGKTLNEVLAIYKEELVGEKLFEKYQLDFPLLFKFIDANDKLSIQVHPNDELARRKHACSGKSEMWYIIEAEEGAELILGFNQHVDKEIYLKHLNAGTLESILNKVKVKAGDSFFIPAGLVHAIGKGILLAEVQQSSDITYRLFDYNRLDSDGNPRQLHTEEALEAIDFGDKRFTKIDYFFDENSKIQLLKCDCFTISLISLKGSFDLLISESNCFVVYMCLEGIVKFLYLNEWVLLEKGEIILVSSTLTSFSFFSNTEYSKLIEVKI